jgi:hypothetical protein
MCFLEIRQKEGSLTTPLALREQTAGELHPVSLDTHLSEGRPD